MCMKNVLIHKYNARIFVNIGFNIGGVMIAAMEYVMI